jgi:hypothetical protein
MRKLNLVLVVLTGCVLCTQPSWGADGPVIVIPGRPGVPVVINGFDASYTVVEGEWGLDRPGVVTPVIVAGPLIAPAPLLYNGYYPAVGRQPGYGRYEIEPPPRRRLPPPAQSFHRFWGSQSDPIPATLDPPAPAIPMIVAPEFYKGKRVFRRPR